MAKKKIPILNEEQTRVNLFIDTIKLDKDLPKYKIMAEKKASEKKDKQYNSEFNQNMSLQEFTVLDNKLAEISYETLRDYFANNVKENMTDFNLTLSEKMRHNIEKTTMSANNFVLFVDRGETKHPEKETLWNTVKRYFRKKNAEKQEKQTIQKFDVVKFFADVKLSSSEEANKYRNRLNEYVACIGYTEKTGQTALKEKLFENLIINKYESILYAKGMYRVLTEETLVKFAKNCPKALSLDYIANYVRTIPLDIIKKKIEVDMLEVFDNYVILHYDPQGNAVEMTPAEKKKEVDKAKDPILFGVIAGSNKLYYIADWIDTTIDDDLTWETMVENLGQDVLEKDFLKDKI